MPVPVVAIVGRPNVGKSSLFNWLAGRRIAIVDPTAGVTRDRVTTLIKLGDRFVELVDTGGMGIEDVDHLTEHVERQIDAALEDAHIILFVVDGRSGLMPLDEEVARRLRYVDKPVICVANKCDDEKIEPQTAEFYKMGRGKLVCVSAQQNRGKERLLDLLAERLPPPDKTEIPPADPIMKVALVGRRNTGKSTFINSLTQTKRMIVSEVPGTTRDSVDVRFERDGKVFIAIDTAGVRKKRSLASDIEFYSMARAERSIRRADVVLLFIDARVRISKVDKKLAEYIFDQHKPAIFVVNKWDLMAPTPTGKMAIYLRQTFPSLDFVPIAFTTATENRNVRAVLNLARNLHKQASARVSTGDLNRVLRMALEAQAPPLRQNRRAKIYYATQVAANPPTIVLFTNGPELFDNTYLRYLVKTFRDNLPFADVPIKLYVRRRSRTEDRTVEDRSVEERPHEETTSRPVAKKPKKQKRKSDAPFSTNLSDEDPGKYDDPELWRDL